MQIIGDDYLTTSAERVRAAIADQACNAVLLKPNQCGTVTETRAALDAAKAAGWGCIVSARSGETEDVSIVHLATGWDAGQLKVGSFARSERMAKWNEALRIEELLGAGARFAGRAALPMKIIGVRCAQVRSAGSRRYNPPAREAAIPSPVSVSAVATAHTRSPRGPILIMTAVALFVVMDTMSKYLSALLPGAGDRLGALLLPPAAGADRARPAPGSRAWCARSAWACSWCAA